MSKNILGIFDGSDIDGVLALIDRLEQSSFDYLKLEGGGVNIVIGKNGYGEAAEISGTAAAQSPAPAPQAAPAPVPAAPEQAAPQAAPAAQEQAASPAVPEEAGVVVIKSPSYGLFYAQPEPGAPPYVKVGGPVSAGATVGLLEIMKTFNAITSPVDGEVVAIHVKNEEMLEPDQPLVSVRVK